MAVAHPLGRVPTSINQPPGGGNRYPFVEPSSDVQYLLSDLYLSYDDPRCQLAQPFHVFWLRGLDDVADPADEHTHDMVLKDANDAVVADTRGEGVTFQSRAWGTRLKILEWVDWTNRWVLRVVYHTAWQQEDIDDGLSVEYDHEIFPTNGRLDPRTILRRNPSVTSLIVGDTVLRYDDVELHSGYNCTVRERTVADEYIDVTDLANELADVYATKRLVTGERVINQIGISAEAGDGIGQVPGCDEVVPVVKNFGDVEPDDAGNINIDVEGCLRSKRPAYLAQSTPRRFNFLKAGLTAEEAMSALEIKNDCLACCECDYYVRTYKGLKRQWNLHQAIADTLNDTRDAFNRNKARWLAEKTCREGDPFTVLFLPEYECKAAGGAIYCNVTGCCIVPLTLRFTFQTYRNQEGVILGGDCRRTRVQGSPHRTGEEEYSFSGEWPVFEATFDYANPGDTSRVAFRVCVPECTEDQVAMLFTVTAHYPDELITQDENEECLVPVIETPDHLDLLWEASTLGQPTWPIRAMKQAPLIPMNPTNAYCDMCTCEATEESES